MLAGRRRSRGVLPDPVRSRCSTCTWIYRRVRYRALFCFLSALALLVPEPAGGEGHVSARADAVTWVWIAGNQSSGGTSRASCALLQEGAAFHHQSPSLQTQCRCSAPRRTGRTGLPRSPHFQTRESESQQLFGDAWRRECGFSPRPAAAPRGGARATGRKRCQTRRI